MQDTYDHLRFVFRHESSDRVRHKKHAVPWSGGIYIDTPSETVNRDALVRELVRQPVISTTASSQYIHLGKGR
jgi:hypothetical protein